MKRSYALAVAAGAAAVLGLAGTALAASDDATSSPSPSPSSEVFRGDGSLDDDSGPSSSPTVEPGSVTPTPRSGGSATSGLGGAVASFSAEQARMKALATVGGGRVTKVEAETEHGRTVWEVEVHVNGVEHDLDIDRRTGAVTDHDRSRGDDHDRGDDRGRSGDARRGGDDARHGDDDGRSGDDARHGDDNGGHGRGGDDD